MIFSSALWKKNMRELDNFESSVVDWVVIYQRRIQGRGDGGCNPPFGQNFLVIFFLFFLKNN